MPVVRREGAELYYEVHGDGPAIAFAHGSGGNTLIWWQQVPHFAKSRRVLVYDHRGWGRSRCDPAELHPRHFASDLAAIPTTRDRRDRPRLPVDGGTRRPSLGHSRKLRAGAVRNFGRVQAPLTATDRARTMALWPARRSPTVLSRRHSSAIRRLRTSIAARGRILPPTRRCARCSDDSSAQRWPATGWRCFSSATDWFFKPRTRRYGAPRPNARSTCLPASGTSSYFEVPRIQPDRGRVSRLTFAAHARRRAGVVGSV